MAEASSRGAQGRKEDRLGMAPLGLLFRAIAAAAVLVAFKFAVNRLGWEFIETLPLLTALMGGVVFTLAILLAGVLTDFKESERIVGELASQVRRLHADLPFIAKSEPLLAQMQAHLLEAVRAMNASLREGEAVHLKAIYKHLDALDQDLLRAAQAGAPSSQLRTVQVGVGAMVRILERLETIIETSFTKAGYAFAGSVILAALAGLAFAQVRPLEQGLALFGFASFLLVGLFLLVADLDNPFAGQVRVSIRQMEKVEAFLAAKAPGPPELPAEARLPQAS